MIRLVLAEDHALVREGISALLGLVPDLALVAEATQGDEAVAACLAHAPDVLLVDMRMPVLDGVGVIRALAARGALPPTLVLTTFDDDEAARAAVAAGARGFLLKDVTQEKLVDAIRTLAAGGQVISPALGDTVSRRLRASPDGSAPAPDPLSEREREVLRLMAAGYSNREIGGALFVAEGTVKNHVSSILFKLRVRDRTRAVLKAVERGYV